MQSIIKIGILVLITSWMMSDLTKLSAGTISEPGPLLFPLVVLVVMALSFVLGKKND